MNRGVARIGPFNMCLEVDRVRAGRARGGPGEAEDLLSIFEETAGGAGGRA